MTYIIYYDLYCKMLHISRRSSASEMIVKSNICLILKHCFGQRLFFYFSIKGVNQYIY